MKLIPFLFLTLSTVVHVKSNEHFTFPPQFRPQNSGGSSPDNSHYLPPETHTSIPYLPMRNFNNLPFPYLPVSTKAPILYPSPFPIMLSSTMGPIEDDDDTEDEKPTPQFQRNQPNNHTERNLPKRVQNRDQKPQSRLNQPIDRNDMKGPISFSPHNPFHVATPRSFIIHAEDPRDNFDQTKSAASPGAQFLPAPGLQNVFISSTTEPAIPILRLSNEMDLDGSFSYEALGADQTHYVQHSRMENMGTDKEEQVVEGSYSYVGDNGQTYTVHYIADSNGFRASGDHLPVAPPIPEIIQRAIQYNLAEESKKPPNLRSWQNNDNEVNESDRNQYQQYANQQPPSRSLFTGKPPEAFSFAFAQGSQNNQNNNLVPAASNQNPIKTNVDFTSEQMKAKTNGAPISPQITFLASQGAHAPSVNSQQTIGRMYNTERPTMPQLINYEAGLKESEQESNKALWRWQYGMNANINQTPEKNSISRSSGVDDVMINFSDMTPEQYTNMIKSQLKPNPEASPNNQNMSPVTEQAILSTASNYIQLQTEKWFTNDNSNQYFQNQNEQIKPEKNNEEITDYSTNLHSKLITQKKFTPPSQTITQTYNYEDDVYESERIRTSTVEPQTSPNNQYQYYEQQPQHHYLKSTYNQLQNQQIVSSTEVPSTTSHEVQFSDFTAKKEQKDITFSKNSYPEIQQKEETTTNAVQNMIKENIFLRNLLKTEKQDTNENDKVKETHFSPKTEYKSDKTPKYVSIKSSPYNEIQTKRKPIDVSDILNYISAKNYFESSKIKPKNNLESNYNNQRNELRFIPVQRSRDDTDEIDMEHSASDFRPSYYQPEELRGIIKNYKVLHRNNSAYNNGHDTTNQKRKLSTPSVKMQSNLPPLGRAGPSMKSYFPPIYV